MVDMPLDKSVHPHPLGIVDLPPALKSMVGKTVTLHDPRGCDVAFVAPSPSNIVNGGPEFLQVTPRPSVRFRCVAPGEWQEVLEDYMLECR